MPSPLFCALEYHSHSVALICPKILAAYSTCAFLDWVRAMTPDEAWWHHWNEVQWLENIQTKETYEVWDSRELSILEAVNNEPHVDEGCFYPCKQSDIEMILDTPTPQPPFRKVFPEMALDELVAFNDMDRRPCRSVRRSIRHLDKYLFNRSRLRSRDIPGLVFKAFRDLDKVLFDEYLFGRVQLLWAGTRLMENIEPGMGSESLLGFAPRRENSGSFIFLCMDSLLLGKGSVTSRGILEGVLETLIHEMLVRSGLLLTLSV